MDIVGAKINDYKDCLLRTFEEIWNLPQVVLLWTLQFVHSVPITFCFKILKALEMMIKSKMMKTSIKSLMIAFCLKSKLKKLISLWMVSYVYMHNSQNNLDLQIICHSLCSCYLLFIDHLRCQWTKSSNTIKALSKLV